MSREVDAARVLRDEFTEAIVSDVALSRDEAVKAAAAVVACLQRTRGGTRFYVPSPGRVYPIDEILGLLATTRDVDVVCREFALSRATLYRLLDAADR